MNPMKVLGFTLFASPIILFHNPLIINPMKLLGFTLFASPIILLHNPLIVSPMKLLGFTFYLALVVGEAIMAHAHGVAQLVGKGVGSAEACGGVALTQRAPHSKLH
jgi:uncharacterized membrane protein YadS